MTAPTSGQHSERSDGDLGAPSERSCTCGLADEKDSYLQVGGFVDPATGEFVKPATLILPARTTHFWDCPALSPMDIIQAIRDFRDQGRRALGGLD